MTHRYQMNYIYVCAGNYHMGTSPIDDPHYELYAAWPGEVKDCPPAVAREVLTAGGIEW